MLKAYLGSRFTFPADNKTKCTRENSAEPAAVKTRMPHWPQLRALDNDVSEMLNDGHRIIHVACSKILLLGGRCDGISNYVIVHAHGKEFSMRGEKYRT